MQEGRKSVRGRAEGLREALQRMRESHRLGDSPAATLARRALLQKNAEMEPSTSYESKTYTDEMRSDVAQYTPVPPNQRMNALRSYTENINRSPEAQNILAGWGLKLHESIFDLDARVLDPEAIIFGRGVTIVPGREGWSNDMIRNKVIIPVDLLTWIVMFTPPDRWCAEEFCQNMRNLGNMGMRISRPILHMLEDDRIDTYIQACKNLISSQVQMPIPSQVIIAKTLSSPEKVRKIALQINCKLGGRLWSVRLPFKNWMICGIDVYRSPNMKRSVCAFVCNLKEDFSAWYSTAAFQDGDAGDFLKTCLMKCLEKYRRANGVLPSKIIIYRDGLEEHQLEHCIDYEVAQFEECVRQYNVEDVNICVVVVQKYINTRIFVKNGSELKNPHPGTVLDNTITKRNWYDFFLVSENVNHKQQQAATPTRYIVIYDACNLKPDHVQRLTYKLCHLCYSVEHSIKVPALCQYAHSLAVLVGRIGKIPAETLEGCLFYL